MRVEAAEAARAYTYAWWLTGDEARAARAVAAALNRPEVAGASPTVRLEILLRRVRASAIAAPTMCPASELALLHDATGLSLGTAAGLAAIAEKDARTELAHGRLEALDEEPDVEIAHPERLGGLAVGNPADVAHARQCASCGRVRELLLVGRDELGRLPTMPLPPSLAELVVGRGGWTGPGAVDDTQPIPPARAPGQRAERATADTARDAAAAPSELTEVDLREALDEPAHQEPRRRRRGASWAAVAVLLLLAVVAVGAFLVSRSPDAADPGPGAGARPTATGAATGDADPPATEVVPAPEATATDEQGLVVEEMGLVLADRGADGPVADAAIDAFDALRVEVRYRNASPDAAPVEVRWTLDGQPYQSLELQLSARRTSQLFGAPVPVEGWPAGVHELVLVHDGRDVARTRFSVAGAAD